MKSEKSSAMQDLRQAIADLEATRRQLKTALPQHIAALIEWREAFKARLRLMGLRAQRRKKR